MLNDLLGVADEFGISADIIKWASEKFLQFFVDVVNMLKSDDKNVKILGEKLWDALMGGTVLVHKALTGALGLGGALVGGVAINVSEMESAAFLSGAVGLGVGVGYDFIGIGYAPGASVADIAGLGLVYDGSFGGVLGGSVSGSIGGNAASIGVAPTLGTTGLQGFIGIGGTIISGIR